MYHNRCCFAAILQQDKLSLSVQLVGLKQLCHSSVKGLLHIV